MIYATAIIQARMGSTRLPGKVLMDLCGKPILQHVIERVTESHASRVMVATTENPADSAISDLCSKLGVLCYRGPADDVLTRYIEAARIGEAEAIIRITADCPLIDPTIIDRCIHQLELMPFIDYAANIVRRTYPRGLDVEVFWADVLHRLDRISTSSQAREHVTWMTRTRPDLFERFSIEGPQNDSDLRWTVDTAADLGVVRSIVESGCTSYLDRVAYARSHPWCTANADVEQKDA